MKMISFDDFQDKYTSKIGTLKRDAFEKEVEEAVQAYKVGEAHKQARKTKCQVQDENGNVIAEYERKISSRPNSGLAQVKYMKLNGPAPKPRVQSRGLRCLEMSMNQQTEKYEETKNFHSFDRRVLQEISC